MIEQISNDYLARNAALADKLENKSLPRIMREMNEFFEQGKTTAGHYAREEYAITEAIIYALRNNRIARTDEDIERLRAEK